MAEAKDQKHFLLRSLVGQKKPKRGVRADDSSLDRQSTKKSTRREEGKEGAKYVGPSHHEDRERNKLYNRIGNVGGGLEHLRWIQKRWAKDPSGTGKVS